MKKNLLVLGALLLVLSGCTKISAQEKENMALIENYAPKGTTVTLKDGVYEVALSRTGIRLEDVEGWETYKDEWMQALETLTSEHPAKVRLTYDGETVLNVEGSDIIEFTPIDCGCGITK